MTIHFAEILGMFFTCDIEMWGVISLIHICVIGRDSKGYDR